MAAPFRFGLSNHRPTGRRKEPPLFFSWSVQQIPGHPSCPSEVLAVIRRPTDRRPGGARCIGILLQKHQVLEHDGVGIEALEGRGVLGVPRSRDYGAPRLEALLRLPVASAPVLLVPR